MIFFFFSTKSKSIIRNLGEMSERLLTNTALTNTDNISEKYCYFNNGTCNMLITEMCNKFIFSFGVVYLYLILANQMQL